MASHFQKVESDLYERARKALTELCAREGPAQCERVLAQALGEFEQSQQAHTFDCQPFSDFDEYPSLNAAYEQRLHRDLVYQRDR
jgi:hypothetical protein